MGSGAGAASPGLGCAGLGGSVVAESGADGGLILFGSETGGGGKGGTVGATWTGSAGVGSVPSPVCASVVVGESTANATKAARCAIGA